MEKFKNKGDEKRKQWKEKKKEERMFNLTEVQSRGVWVKWVTWAEFRPVGRVLACCCWPADLYLTSLFYAVRSWAKQTRVMSLSNTESIYLSRHRISEEISPNTSLILMNLENCIPEFKTDWPDGAVVFKGQNWSIWQQGSKNTAALMYYGTLL